MLPRPIASIASIPSIAITSALLILTANSIALAENPPSSELPLLLAQTNDPRKAEADALFDQGIQQYRVSQFQEALRLWEQALNIYREIEDVFGQGKTLDRLGAVNQDIGQYQQAIQYLEEALEFARLLDFPQGEAATLGNLGIAYYRLGQYDTAIAFHQQALTIDQEIGDRAGEAADLGNLGNAYYSLGQYDRAIAFHQQSLAIKEEIGDRKGEANSFGNLGNAYNSLGQYDRAIAFHQQALTINREIGARQGEALNLGNLGIAYYSLGQYDRAIDFHQQALTINREIGARQAEAANLGSLGNAYYSLGQYDRAIGFHQQQLAIAREIGDRSGEAISLNNIGVAYRDLQNYSEALSYYRQALPIAQEIGERDSEGLYLSNIGRIFELENQPELAISFYQQSVAVREGIRRDLRNLTTDLQQSYTDTVAYTYRSLADLLLAAGRIDEAQDVLELLKVEEFQDYAATRGFQVASAVASAPDPRPGAVGSPELFPLQATVDLIALGQELVDCERQRPVCGNRDRLQAERDAANANFNRNLERLQAQIRRERADDPARLDPAELSRAAKAVVQGQPNTVLIYPVVLEDKLWLVWGAQSGDRGVVLQSQVVEVSQAQLGLAVQQFRQLLQQADPASVAGVQQLSQRLYGWLIEPIRAELEANGIEHLVFSLDRSTRYIPLAALFDGQRYLVQDFTISTILTAGLTDLSDTLAPSVNHNPVLAMGLSEAVAGQAPLPNVPAELAGIVGDSNRRGVFPGSSFLNRRFSLDTLEDNLINHRILHLATHGIFTSRRPGESYILLGTGEKLTIPEIKTLEDLAGVHLVTLSACETGLGGPDEDGLEVSGMSYFFLTSGAKSVLASLWQVSDASTSELMQGFYAVLAQGGVTKAEALRQAQLQVLATPGFEHPFFWAPFYLVGNNR